MSLRFRLICLIAIVLIASLAVEGTIVSFNASRSVQTEMNSALQVGQQIVKSALARLPDSTDRRHDLEALVAAFKGNRHLRVSLTGGEEASVEPSLEGSHFGTVPPWFVRLLGISPVAARVPVAIAGQDYGSIILESDPTMRSSKSGTISATASSCSLCSLASISCSSISLSAAPCALWITSASRSSRSARAITR